MAASQGALQHKITRIFPKGLPFLLEDDASTLDVTKVTDIRTYIANSD